MPIIRQASRILLSIAKHEYPFTIILEKSILVMVTDDIGILNGTL